MSNVGLWLPPGTQSPGSQLASDIVPEAQRIVEWVRKWPRTGEPPLNPHDVAALVYTRAQIALWDRDKMEAICKFALSELGMNGKPQPAGKKDRNLKPVCNHVRLKDMNAQFSSCLDCGTVVKRPFNPSGAEPSRITRTDATSMRRISTREPNPKDTTLRMRLPE